MHFALKFFLLLLNLETVCEYPGKPRFGEISGEFPAHFRYVATYTCAPGYSLEGAEAVVCMADGTWSDSKPTCQRKCRFLISHPDERCLACHAYKKMYHNGFTNSFQSNTSGESIIAWFPSSPKVTMVLQVPGVMLSY